MKIPKKARAGTLQSSDLMVHIAPADELTIEIESTVKKQFEHLIREKVEEVLTRFEIEAGHVRVADRGALDYAIEARLSTAIQRSLEE